MPRIFLLRSLLLRALVSDIVLSGGGIKPSTAVTVASSRVSGVTHSPPGEFGSPKPGDDGPGGGSGFPNCNPTLESCSSVSATKMGCDE